MSFENTKKSITNHYYVNLLKVIFAWNFKAQKKERKKIYILQYNKFSSKTCMLKIYKLFLALKYMFYSFAPKFIPCNKKWLFSEIQTILISLLLNAELNPDFTATLVNVFIPIFLYMHIYLLRDITLSLMEYCF